VLVPVISLTNHDCLYLTSLQVRARYGGVSDMALWRWLRNPKLGFPRPIKINGRNYWRLDELEAWERRNRAEV